jgi:hypothetical protein
MDAAFGLPAATAFEPSPLLQPTTREFMREVLNPARTDLDKPIRQFCHSLLVEATQATADLFKDLGRQMLANLTPEQQVNARQLLAQREVAKAKDPKSEPFMSDRRAEMLAVALATAPVDSRSVGNATHHACG